jgi:large subunit ribosomal protein L24e
LLGQSKNYRGEKMVKCSFCGEDLKVGGGKIYAKKDGTTFHFCSNKCEKNLIEMKRKPVETKWTQAHHKLKNTLTSAKQEKKVEAKDKGEKK